MQIEWKAEAGVRGRFGLLAALVALAGCPAPAAFDDDDALRAADDDDDNADDDDAVGDGLTLTTAGLPATGPGQYALWLVDDAGTFDLAGTFIDNDGVVVDADLENYAEAVVTVQSTREDPREPGPELLRGPVEDGAIQLEMSIRFGAQGAVSLWTPTDNDSDTENFFQGAWFLDSSGGGPAPGLRVEEPPEGWVYAAWVRTQGYYLPMGSFTAADQRDSDCFFCGGQPGADLPGEDFVANLPAEIEAEIDLTDGESAVVVSISPGPYDISAAAYEISPGPYDLTEAPPFRFALDIAAADLAGALTEGELTELADPGLEAPSASLTR